METDPLWERKMCSGQLLDGRCKCIRCHVIKKLYTKLCWQFNLHFHNFANPMSISEIIFGTFQPLIRGLFNVYLTRLFSTKTYTMNLKLQQSTDCRFTRLHMAHWHKTKVNRPIGLYSIYTERIKVRFSLIMLCAYIYTYLYIHCTQTLINSHKLEVSSIKWSALLGKVVNILIMVGDRGRMAKQKQLGLK